MIYDGIPGLIRIAIVSVRASTGINVILRISGCRTLSEMKAFAFVVTVALGSTLATTFLSRDVALAESIMAIAVLVGLQFAFTWLSVRAQWLSRAITLEPILLCYDGRRLPGRLRDARVFEREMFARRRP